ncbi:hypothetical protein PN462_06095 [Spirulina sp. CS-785/01]|uniref:hypothetical protein n=1 Tax=Spirulina sp. CS-785/01 TaxID=3021716 RepID=UPI00232ED99D|nr:hypothetical protein [Spirulina sp. CS-785/01]MDB9312666.1 hypothetical protein [Spirulina sp. CS-785/01]
MTPILLRHLWSLVENAQAQVILALDDSSLVDWLIAQIGKQRSLENHETEVLSHYIRSKTSLIRDIAGQQV